MDRPPDGRVLTTDHGYSLKMDGGRIRTFHLMDGFGQRTIKNIEMWSPHNLWTEVNEWTDGQKSVRGGLVPTRLGRTCVIKADGPCRLETVHGVLYTVFSDE